MTRLDDSSPDRSSTATSTLRSTPLATQSFTFSQIIDADHFTIERLAARIRSPTTPRSQLQSLLHEVIWRLIRHDFSEDMVMRPAFARLLGEEGVQMAEHDRRDHANARNLLVPLLDLDLHDEAAFEETMHTVARVFDELGEHMAVESGEMIPKFETICGDDVSRKLGREYARTLVLTPDAVIGRDGDRRKAFTSGVRDYVLSDMERYRKVYEELEEEAKTRPAHFDEAVEEQLRIMQVGKWMSLNQRKALQTTRDAVSSKGRL